MFRLVAFGALFLGRAFAAGEVDPAKWAQLKQGMAESEVVRILGAPLRREEPASNRSTLIYGELAPKSDVFPAGLAYVIWLDENKSVNSLETPFGSAAPRNGPPGKPVIFLPQAGITFHHYPRILDVRWYAVTGTYPMQYEIEQDSGYAPQDTLIWHTAKTLKTALPYVSITHGGGQPGRLRVRALNAEGPGPWSEYVVFEFTR